MSRPSDQDKAENNTDGFMESLGNIRKLKTDRADLYRDKPKKLPRVNHLQHFSLTTPGITETSDQNSAATAESWFDHGIQKKLRRRIQMGQLQIEAHLDLHGYRQHEALKELKRFMQHAIDDGLHFIMIIHGKGFRSQSESVLRPLVQHWLSQQPAVLAYCPAQTRDGGNGASYVYLRKA